MMTLTLVLKTWISSSEVTLKVMKELEDPSAPFTASECCLAINSLDIVETCVKTLREENVLVLFLSHIPILSTF